MTREQALENALRDVQQYVIAWRYEYASKPNDAHNNQQRDRIDTALKQMAAALALPPDNADMLAALRICADPRNSTVATIAAAEAAIARATDRPPMPAKSFNPPATP